MDLGPLHHPKAHSLFIGLCVQVIHASIKWMIYQPKVESVECDVTIFHDAWFFKRQSQCPARERRSPSACTKKLKKNSSSHCWREAKKNGASVNLKASETRIKSTKQKASQVKTRSCACEQASCFGAWITRFSFFSSLAGVYNYSPRICWSI